MLFKATRLDELTKGVQREKEDQGLRLQELELEKETKKKC